MSILCYLKPFLVQILFFFKKEDRILKEALTGISIRLPHLDINCEGEKTGKKLNKEDSEY
jgi:hypothetical protein